MSRSRRVGRQFAHRLYKLGWANHRRDGSLRHRIYTALSTQDGWWDWGHPLMALVGRPGIGSYDPPRARDLYMRVGWARREDHTAIEGTQTERIETTHAMTAWDGVKRGEEWRTFDWQDDGHTLRVGWLGDDGRLHDSGIGAVSGELRRFRRWFIWDSWVKADWFGLRRWAYYKGLHQAVHQRRPFTCQQVPGRLSGGYQHWHCELRRRHPGDHRFRNMCWSDGGRVYRSVPAEAVTA